MRGLCKSKCGLDIDYEPIEFSDGFTYYLPRNLDGTYHNCVMLREDIQNYLECAPVDDHGNLELDNLNENFTEIIKINSKLSLDEFEKIKSNMNEDPVVRLDVDNYGIDFDLVQTLIDGKMLVLKNEIEKQMISVPAPFFMIRSDNQTNAGWYSQEKHDINLTDATNKDIALLVYLETPTNNGYQLEYLGKYYELMLKLEDAKKCFILQHDITGEPELKEHADKLDKDIEEKNIMYPKNNKTTIKKITIVKVNEAMKKTELNIQKYIREIYENKFDIIWTRFPQYKKSIENRREKQENSLIPNQEKSLIQHLTLGQLCTIMLNTNNRKKTNRDGKCNICDTKFQKGDYLFLEKIKVKEKIKTIICKNEKCFLNQGGLHKKIKKELISIFQLIVDFRNPTTHDIDKNYENYKEFWELDFKRVIAECQLLDYYIDEFLNNKKFT